MIFTYPEINKIFDTECKKINALVIEHPKLLYRLLSDIQSQMEGDEGKAVLSEKHKIIPIRKKLELLTQFVPFDLNKKNIVHSICSRIEKNAMEGEWYERTMRLMTELETLLYDTSFSLPGGIDFPKININTILKSAGVEIREDQESLCEKILDYMELVNEYEEEKLFLIVNLRSYVDDGEMSYFFDTLLRKHYHAIIIDSSEHIALSNEERFIVDSDFCEIS